eukprot:13744271-Alexandrium_andersonii.AAC.1
MSGSLECEETSYTWFETWLQSLCCGPSAQTAWNRLVPGPNVRGHRHRHDSVLGPAGAARSTAPPTPSSALPGARISLLFGPGIRRFRVVCALGQELAV